MSSKKLCEESIPEINSIKHRKAWRHPVPSREEAGFEDANPKAQCNSTAQYPVNPAVHRGQYPELFWLDKHGNDERDDLL